MGPMVGHVVVAWPMMDGPLARRSRRGRTWQAPWRLPEGRRSKAAVEASPDVAAEVAVAEGLEPLGLQGELVSMRALLANLQPVVHN